jgi:hypothetical protein
MGAKIVSQQKSIMKEAVSLSSIGNAARCKRHRKRKKEG